MGTEGIEEVKEKKSFLNSQNKFASTISDERQALRLSQTPRGLSFAGFIPGCLRRDETHHRYIIKDLFNCHFTNFFTFSKRHTQSFIN